MKITHTQFSKLIELSLRDGGEIEFSCFSNANVYQKLARRKLIEVDYLGDFKFRAWLNAEGWKVAREGVKSI